jgi:tRNA G10  N-methylase Trm11
VLQYVVELSLIKGSKEGNELDNLGLKAQKFVYTYACREEERSLSELEIRSLFGVNSQSSYIVSPLKVDPSRSPFIRERIDVMIEGLSLQDIIGQVKDLPTLEKTFKVILVKHDDHPESDKWGLKERRAIEREVGTHIMGEADLDKPELLLGIIKVNEIWMFGQYSKNEAVWLRHQSKPNGYSTALSTRVARSVVNIAVPNPINKKVIDPCCGIGTVVVEALSMGIDIVGSDKNHLILPGVRENLAHFGLEGEVSLGDMRNINNSYDAAIIDMPYNLCSVLSPEEQLEMLQSARRFTKRMVIITIEQIDSILLEAGFEIVDRCVVKKGKLTRQIIVCE